MKTYKDNLADAMQMAASHNKVIFCGQAVAYNGTAMRDTLTDIPQNKLIEFPVDEDFQMGFCNGLALASFIPVCIFPRWNFLLLATNQIVNYLDKVESLTKFQIHPKVLIRTAIGSEQPLNPGIQHIGDYSEAFKLMLKNINVVTLNHKDMILKEYENALELKNQKSTILIEQIDLYNS